MHDILGKIISFVIAAVMIFYVPIMLIAISQDSLRQTYINNRVVSFVDDARSTGKISPDAYRRLSEDIGSMRVGATISLTHSKKYAVPEFDAGGQVKGFETRYEDMTSKEILHYIYESDPHAELDYDLSDGDFLKCVVRSDTQTLGEKVLSFFTAKPVENSIFVSYAGYVGNINQK